jgi:hypothetical protein
MGYSVYQVNSYSERDDREGRELNAVSLLYDRDGDRKYLTVSERTAFLAAARMLPPSERTFCLMLAYTGARISEVLALTSARIDSEAGVVILESLKKRTWELPRHPCAIRLSFRLGSGTRNLRCPPKCRSSAATYLDLVPDHGVEPGKGLHVSRGDLRPSGDNQGPSTCLCGFVSAGWGTNQFCPKVAGALPAEHYGNLQRCRWG